MDDLIQVIKILNSSEIEQVNQYIDNLEFRGCNVFTKNSKKPKVEKIRTSTGTSLNDDCAITQLIHKAINKGLEEYKMKIQKIHHIFSHYPVPGGLSTKSWREKIQVLEYTKGQEYKFHKDEVSNPELREYHRKISVILYLKEATKGGGTLFPHCGIKPKPGYALIFPSNWCYPHAGEPVYAGKKRVAVTWYYVEHTD